jgi:hypothetical protein
VSAGEASGPTRYRWPDRAATIQDGTVQDGATQRGFGQRRTRQCGDGLRGARKRGEVRRRPRPALTWAPERTALDRARWWRKVTWTAVLALGAGNARVAAPVSAVAFGPDGEADGDNPQDAAFVIGRGWGVPWETDWYTTPGFGDLKAGTGLLLDMGRAARRGCGSLPALRARYLLLWFTRLPPDTAGTYQASVYDVRVTELP